MQHAIAECWVLYKLVHRGIKERTLKLTQPEIQSNPFPNHKGKEVATIVICTDPSDEEEERPSLPTEAIMTLQRSS